MKTAEQTEKEFRQELQNLLNKYGAELEASDHWIGYNECGEDIRMIVTINSKYDENNNCVQERTEIDLGSWMTPTPAKKT